MINKNFSTFVLTLYIKPLLLLLEKNKLSVYVKKNYSHSGRRFFVGA